MPGDVIAIEGSGEQFTGLSHISSVSHQMSAAGYALPSADEHRCDDARVLMLPDLLL
jgi:hypothetical protein